MQKWYNIFKENTELLFILHDMANEKEYSLLTISHTVYESFRNEDKRKESGS